MQPHSAILLAPIQASPDMYYSHYSFLLSTFLAGGHYNVKGSTICKSVYSVHPYFLCLYPPMAGSIDLSVASRFTVLAILRE